MTLDTSMETTATAILWHRLIFMIPQQHHDQLSSFIPAGETAGQEGVTATLTMYI